MRTWWTCTARSCGPSSRCLSSRACRAGHTSSLSRRANRRTRTLATTRSPSTPSTSASKYDGGQHGRTGDQTSMEIASLLGIWVHPDDQTSLLQPLLDLAQPTPGHSRLAAFDAFDNLGDRAPGTRGTLAGREQDPGIRPGAGGCAASREQAVQRRAVLGARRHDILPYLRMPQGHPLHPLSLEWRVMGR